MGTRALVDVLDRDNRVLVRIYSQYDGYPDELGIEIAKPLANSRIVNGFRVGQDNPEVFNGMEDLAAWLVMYLKQNVTKVGGGTIGTIYIYPRIPIDLIDYHYRVFEKDGRVWMSVLDCEDELLFEGPAKEFLEQFPK